MRWQLAPGDLLPQIVGDAEVCGLVTKGHVRSLG